MLVSFKVLYYYHYGPQQRDRISVFPRRRSLSEWKNYFFSNDEKKNDPEINWTNDINDLFQEKNRKKTQKFRKKYSPLLYKIRGIPPDLEWLAFENSLKNKKTQFVFFCYASWKKRATFCDLIEWMTHQLLKKKNTVPLAAYVFQL